MDEVKKIRGYCVNCVALCPTVAVVEEGRFTRVLPDRDHPNAVEKLCPKGLAGPEVVYSDERLKYPMRRTKPKGSPDPGWERISWDEALDSIAVNLKEIKDRYGAEAVAFHRSAPASTPALEFNNLAIRLAYAFGSPNNLATTHICQWARDALSAYTYGAGLLDAEFEHSSCILIWGQNPSNTWQTLSRDIKKALDKGAKLIVVDPRKTDLTQNASLWLQIMPGTDHALALSLLNILLREKLYDREFTLAWTNAPFLVRCDSGDLIRAREVFPEAEADSLLFWDKKTGTVSIFSPRRVSFDSNAEPALSGSYMVRSKNGGSIACKPVFQLLKECVESCTPEWAEKVTGIPVESIRQAARWYGGTKPACYYTWNGIEQQVSASQLNRTLCILYALTGNYDTKGSNRYFPRIPVNPDSGYEFLNPEIEKKRLGFTERPLGPAGAVQPYKATRSAVRPNDFYEAVINEKPYPVKALVSFGGNLSTGNPESLRAIKALEKLSFYVHADLFLNPSSSYADIILPSASCWETTGVRPGFRHTLTASRHLQLREPVVPPRHEARPDLEIIFALAVKLGLSDRFWGGDVRASLDYQINKTGFTVKDLEGYPGGITLDYQVQEKGYSLTDPGTGIPVGFSTPSRRIELYSQVFKDYGYDPLPAYDSTLYPKSNENYPLILTCFKLLEYNHGMGRGIPSLRKRVPHPFVEINPHTARGLGLEDGDWVLLETEKGGMRAKAVFVEGALREVVYTQHGWWQECQALDLPGYDPFSPEGSNVNMLLSADLFDNINGSYHLKGNPCRLKKV